MTSKPASRRARATILAPRSCPSSPGLATTTLTLRSAISSSSLSERGPDAVGHAHDVLSVARDQLPVEALAVARPPGNQVEVKVGDGLEGRGAVGLEQIETVGHERFADRSCHLLGRDHDRLEILRVGLVNRGRMLLGRHQAMTARERIDVHEGDGLRVLVDLGRRDLPVADSTEYAIYHPQHASGMLTVGEMVRAIRELSLTVGEMVRAIRELSLTVGEMVRAIRELSLTVGELVRAIRELSLTVG